MGTLLFASSLNNEVVGVVILVPPENSNKQITKSNEGEVRLLAVDPEYRKAGIGKELCLALEKVL